MERKLSAILAADVVGYSRLMGDDEIGTLERLKELRKTLVQPCIKRHKGRIAKLMGDGLLAEFPSVIEAVQCALEIQREMRTRNSAEQDDHRIQLRIGVNLGDIIVEGTDIYGDGVNIAARLETIAEPGGVCISGSAFDVVDGKLDFDFVDTGRQSVKNIKKKVQTYQVNLPTSESDYSTGRNEETEQSFRPSIAILPFANMSGESEQDYFSDGITEDLITEISRFRELAVVSRNSSFVFKGKNEPLRDVSRKLNAQFILEGSVQKAGQRVRVTAQLVDAREDSHIWAERYDRALEDIFEVQDDIVRCIASTLVGRLEAGQLTKIRSLSNEQLRAYDLFLRGRDHFFNWSIDENRKARDCLQSALEIEPDNAPVLALLSEVLLRMWLNGWSNNADTDRSLALQLAKKADEIDDDDSRTQTSLGMAYLFNGEPDKAKHHFEAALRINPNDTRVIIYYSRHAVFDGDIEKAINLCQHALTLNPYGKYNWNLGLASFAARDYEDAISLLDAIRNPPESVLALLAASYAMAGKSDKAHEVYQDFAKAVEEAPGLRNLQEPSNWKDYFEQRWPFCDQNDLEHLVLALRKAGLPI
ncbi:MAG: tetratricopeptide repeat protein [Hyphomicrobiales bacterium]